MNRAEELKDKFYAIKKKQDQFSATIDRSMQIAQLELQTEMAVQLIEINEKLAKLSILNFEKLALDLGQIVRPQLVKNKEKKDGTSA